MVVVAVIGRFWKTPGPFLVLLLLASEVRAQDAATCVEYGATAALSCGVTLTGGQTLRTAFWKKEGLTPDDRVAEYLLGTSSPGPAFTGRASVNNTGFLLLTNVQQNDEGTYLCESVSVNLSPSGTASLPDVDILLGNAGPPTSISCNTPYTTVNSTDEVTINCTADPGCPPAQPSWTQMPTTDQVSSSNGILNILSVTKNHAGTYVCAASNTHGERQCQINLLVQYLEAVAVQSTLSFDKLDGSVRLEASVDAFPAAEIVWRKTGSQEELKHSTDMFFDVSSAGKYTCTAENLLGSTSCGEFEVVVTVWKLVLVIVIPLSAVIAAIVAVAVVMCKKSKILPKAPAKIKLQPVPSSQKVEIQWTAESKGSYKILYRLQGSDDWTHVDVSADSHPYYKHTVDFQQDGRHEVCVLVSNAKGEIKSEIRKAEVKASGLSGEADSGVSPLHGNNAPKSDVVLVISEGQSHPLMKHKLEPIETKQNPAVKKTKKKKKRKKLNAVHTSEEELKPPED